MNGDRIVATQLPPMGHKKHWAACKKLGISSSDLLRWQNEYIDVLLLLMEKEAGGHEVDE